MVSMLKTVFGRFLPGRDMPAVSLRARMLRDTERFLNDHRQQPEVAWPRRTPLASDAAIGDRDNPFRSAAGRRMGPS